MQNLAGNKECDVYIEQELERCEIESVRVERGHTEVPYTITGKLGSLVFTRGWYYWMISGKVPIAIANELYADPVGKEDIRVRGHCGCPPPDGWTKEIDGKQYVMSYHIDSEVGLRLFADTIKKHGLV